VECPEVVPALHSARLRERHCRPLAAVAEGAPGGRRAALDQQRRRHPQLRDAAHRPAAARLRSGPLAGGRLTVAPRSRGRGGWTRSTARRGSSTARMVVNRGCAGAHLDRGRDGGARSEGRAGHLSRAARGGHLERARHPSHLVGRWRCAARSGTLRRRGSSRSSACTPRRRLAPDGGALRCHAGPRDDRRRIRSRPRAADPPAGGARERDPRNCPWRGSARPRSCGRCLRDRRGAGRTRRLGARAAPPGRHARGRPDRGGRAQSTASSGCPRRCPRGAARPAKLTHAQRVPAPRGCARQARGLHEVVGWSFTEPALLDRLRLPHRPTRCAASWRSRPALRRAVDHASTLLGSLRTRPATTSHATARMWRSSSPAPSIARARAATPSGHQRAPCARRRCSPARCAALRRAARQGGLFAAKGPARSAVGALPRGLVGAGAAVAVPAPGDRSAAVLAGGRTLGVPRRLAPLVAGAWTWSARRPSRSISACSPRWRPRSSPTPLRLLPALLQDLAVTLPQGVPRRGGAPRGCRAQPGRCSRARRVFDVYEGEQWGRPALAGGSRSPSATALARFHRRGRARRCAERIVRRPRGDRR